MAYKKGTVGYTKWKARRVWIRHRRNHHIRRYKEKKGCELCGYNKHGVALHFDHVDRTLKCFEPSSRSMNMSLKRIVNEIRKCRILCANCHSVESFEQKHFSNLYVEGRHRKYQFVRNIKRGSLNGI